MIRAVLFDVDGTLMDNNALHIQAWKEAFAPYKALDDAELLRHVGKGSDSYVQSLAPELDSSIQQGIRDHKRALYREMGKAATPFAGAQSVLSEAHRRGLTVALASSANRTEIDRYVSLMGIDSLVSAVVTASDVARTKPDPDLFLAALAKLGIPPAEAFVVGDTVYDVQAAHAAGMPAIAVLSGGISRAALEAAGARTVLRDVGELAERFGEILTKLETRGT